MNVFTLARKGADCVRAKENCRILSVDLNWEGLLTFSYIIGGSPHHWKWSEGMKVETWYSVEIKQHSIREKVLNNSQLIFSKS